MNQECDDDMLDDFFFTEADLKARLENVRCVYHWIVCVRFLEGQHTDGARLMLPTVSLCLSLFFFPKAKPPGIEYLQHSLVWLCFIPQSLV